MLLLIIGPLGHGLLIAQSFVVETQYTGILVAHCTPIFSDCMRHKNSLPVQVKPGKIQKRRMYRCRTVVRAINLGLKTDKLPESHEMPVPYRCTSFPFAGGTMQLVEAGSKQCALDVCHAVKFYPSNCCS